MTKQGGKQSGGQQDQERQAYDQAKQSGATGPDGQALPDYDQADDATKAHVRQQGQQK